MFTIVYEKLLSGTLIDNYETIGVFLHSLGNLICIMHQGKISLNIN